RPGERRELDLDAIRRARRHARGRSAAHLPGLLPRSRPELLPRAARLDVQRVERGADQLATVMNTEPEPFFTDSSRETPASRPFAVRIGEEGLWLGTLRRAQQRVQAQER